MISTTGYAINVVLIIMVNIMIKMEHQLFSITTGENSSSSVKVWRSFIHALFTQEIHKPIGIIAFTVTDLYLLYL